MLRSILIKIGHAVTLRSTDGYELICHIGVDTVSLGGKGLTPQVRAGAKVLAGQPLIRFDLDYLVQNAPAVVTPICPALPSPGFTSGRPMA